MQTWLAYRLDAGVELRRIAQALDRVERHYYPDRRSLQADSGGVERQEVIDPLSGMALWDAKAPDCSWPSWVEHRGVRVATVLMPVGWQRVARATDGVPPSIGLAEAVFAGSTDALSGLTPPFILARYTPAARPTLEIANDGLGYGTLYHYRYSGGDVWSNRLAALPIFAGTRAVPNERAWKTFAGCGWFMGNDVPVEGATLVPPGTVLRAGSRAGSELSASGAVSRWVNRHGAGQVDDDDVIAALGQDLEQLGVFFSEPPLVDLTAGRDSRLIAAVAVADDLPVAFRTENPRWEVQTARRLLELTGRDYRHLTPPAPDAAGVPADSGWESARQRVQRIGFTLAERGAQLHHRHDGDWPPVDLVRGIPQDLVAPRHARVAGAAGELAKGHFGKRHDYMHGASAADVSWFLDSFFRAQASGVTAEGTALVSSHVRETVDLGLRLGVRTDSLREFFYLMERVRRWGRTNRFQDATNPLLNPTFIRAAFDLSSEQRARGELHQRIIHRLMPAWRAVPYNDPAFIATSQTAAPTPDRGQRRYDVVQVEELGQYIHAQDTWEDSFEPSEVKSAWVSAVRGESRAAHRRLFHRLLWRATYEEHLRLVNRAAAPSADPAAVITASPPAMMPGAFPLVLLGGQPESVASVLKLLRSAGPELAIFEGAAIQRHWMQPDSPIAAEALLTSSASHGQADGEGKQSVVGAGRRLVAASARLGVTEDEVLRLAARHRSPFADVIRLNAVFLDALLRLALARSGKRAIVVPVGREVVRAAKYDRVWPDAARAQLLGSGAADTGDSPVGAAYSYDAALSEPAAFASWLHGLARTSPTLPSVTREADDETAAAPRSHRPSGRG